MKIKEIFSGHRFDFKAIMECEHCGHTSQNNHGYNDDNYHQEVIPNMLCEKCGKKR